MSHTKTEKQKLLTRIRRVRGQLEAVERTVEMEAECAAVLQQITACRGALDGLVAEVVEHTTWQFTDGSRRLTEKLDQIGIWG